MPNDAIRPLNASLTVRALTLLAEYPDGLTLADLVLGVGRSGRPASRETAVRLRDLAKADPPRVHRAHAAGERTGTYTITPAGRAWLQRRTLPVDHQAEVVLSTGAMRFEARTVVYRAAVPGQAPVGLVSSVFALGRSVSGDPLAPPRSEPTPRRSRLIRIDDECARICVPPPAPPNRKGVAAKGIDPEAKGETR